MRSSYKTKIEGKRKFWTGSCSDILRLLVSMTQKKNKSQRLLTNQNLLSVEGLHDGTKCRVAFVEGCGVLI